MRARGEQKRENPAKHDNDLPGPYSSPWQIMTGQSQGHMGSAGWQDRRIMTGPRQENQAERGQVMTGRARRVADAGRQVMSVFGAAPVARIHVPNVQWAARYSRRSLPGTKASEDLQGKPGLRAGLDDSALWRVVIN
jgi:hypothetical protein